MYLYINKNNYYITFLNTIQNTYQTYIYHKKTVFINTPIDAQIKTLTKLFTKTNKTHSNKHRILRTLLHIQKHTKTRTNKQYITKNKINNTIQGTTLYPYVYIPQYTLKKPK